jgi:hypothetical protein
MIIVEIKCISPVDLYNLYYLKGLFKGLECYNRNGDPRAGFRRVELGV